MASGCLVVPHRNVKKERPPNRRILQSDFWEAFLLNYYALWRASNSLCMVASVFLSRL